MICIGQHTSGQRKKPQSSSLLRDGFRTDLGVVSGMAGSGCLHTGERKGRTERTVTDAGFPPGGVLVEAVWSYWL